MNNCPIEGRELCKFIGSEGCETCQIRLAGKKADPVEIADNWDITLSLLPDDIDDLHAGEGCSFCKASPGRKIGYEYLCMKHKEPIHKKGMFFGFGTKVEGDVGSIVDIPISVCSKCRAKLTIDKYMSLIGVFGGALIGIILMLIPGIEAALNALHWALPLLTVVVLAVVGYIVGRLVKDHIRKTSVDKMYIDPLNIPQISKMVLLGWSPMQASKKAEPVLSYKKKKLREHMMYKTSAGQQNNEN